VAAARSGPAECHPLEGGARRWRQVVEQRRPGAPFGRAEPVVDGRVVQGVVVADEQNHRALGPVELPGRPGEQIAMDARNVRTWNTLFLRV
jgi:hypothetical protein